MCTLSRNFSRQCLRDADLADCERICVSLRIAMVTSPKTSPMVLTHLVLTLLTPFIDEDDALAFALTCTAVRDALFDRFVRKPLPGYLSGAGPQSRMRTTYAALCSVARLRWAHELSGGILGKCQREGPHWLSFLGACAKTGLADVMQLALQLQLPAQRFWPVVLSKACAGGHIPVMQVIAQVYSFPGAELGSYYEAAAGSGNVHLLQWLKDHGVRRNHSTDYSFETAARLGHLPAMDWLYAEGFRPSGWDMRAALLNGCTESATWLWDRGQRYNGNNNFWEDAIQGGHIAALEYVFAKGFVLYPKALILASQQGIVPVLEWLYQHGCPWPAARSEICTHAARYFGKGDSWLWRDELAEIQMKEARTLVRLWNRKNGCTCEACA